MTQPPAPSPSQTSRILLPHAPALVVAARRAVLITTDGEIEELSPKEAFARVTLEPPLLVHAPAVTARLDTTPFPAFDLLELFAFVRPASFCLPTPRGLAEAMGISVAPGHEAEAESLFDITRLLLEELARSQTLMSAPRRNDVRGIAWTMARADWSWGPSVLAALGVEGNTKGNAALKVWERLPEWSEHAPEPPAGNIPVDPAEARRRLSEILGHAAEQRPQQADYASAVAAAFAPRDAAGAPNMVLAEAGTGTGKTLGYVAPASLWAEKNGAPVWISTYTRNLQRQLDAELDRLFPDAAEKARKVVIRKGRENYLCLLNYEEAVMRNRGQDAVALGLMARWTLATRDGDLTGGDLPGWLPDLLGRARSLGLADRRGECIYSACPHYTKCFIERAVRRARRAEIVVANHALVMVQAALGGLDDATTPTRYVFDEGHHVFDAADSAFSAHLTGAETAELRRWLLGAEGDGSRSRARGLKRRAEDIVGHSDEAAEALDAALHAARCLPGPSWHLRVTEGDPVGPAERFLALVRQQVYARAPSQDGPYSIETDVQPPIPGLEEAALELDEALNRLVQPLFTLGRSLTDLLDDEASELDSATRQRIEGVCRSIERRAIIPLKGWRAMLGHVTGTANEDFVDWFSVERIGGRDADMGMHRHWVDPTRPFAQAVCEPAHGLLVTSATLRDGSGDVERDWWAAERRSGASHLPVPALRATVPSPFDYPSTTRVFVVADVRKDDMAQVAAAYRELFLASGGGGLGLFTAISRLRAVHGRISAPLDDAGLPLYAQHVDNMDVSTMVDIFRAEENACLLGTDAVRDGVDVPGRSLRLIVFDRVPWPRPDILHKARRAAFGGKAYDDMITRLRLKQAFGRLVRRAGDAGVFVLLDPMMPTRLMGAFPEGVQVRRVGLAEAVAETKAFLGREE
ncbi:ATP-dependent DNA helicase [Telmatospirillum sp. J64-1]|uniref:ATP-dependent DNA helicase n=1 Tax=Telmatospirillum sp. J64-1 TaxID=2502183 RepID=UPI00115D8B64|nr:ATP-dependent DNA helicase [Telmatospirillum sp. J64-1]